MADRLVTIATFFEPAEASIAQSILDEENVRSFFADELMASMAWHISGAVGGVKLMVAEPHAERARQILDDYRQQARESTDQPQLDEEFVASLNPTTTDRLISRALRAAVFGLMVPPFFFYSLWLLGRMALRGDQLTPYQHARYVIAMLLNLLMLIGLAVTFLR